MVATPLALAFACALIAWPGATVLAQQAPAAAAPLPARTAAVGDSMNRALMDRIKALGAGSPEALSRMARQTLSAISVHPDALSVEQQIGGAQALVDEARSGWKPQVTASVDAGQRRVTNTNLPGTTLTTQDGLGYGGTVRQLIYDFGATSGAVEAARARLSATDARLNSRRSELALRGVTAWHEVERARQLLALAQDNLRSRTDIVDLVRERYEVGGGSRADLIRAQARQADARATLLAAEVALSSALPAYRELFGEDPAGTGLPSQPAMTELTGNPQELAKRFGSVRESDLLLEGARQDARAADGRSLPTIGLDLNGNRREHSIGGVPGYDMAALVVMRYNLYTGGADSARREQAYRRVLQNEQDRANLLRQVERNIEQTQAQLRSADAMLASRREAVLSASDSLLAVKEQFAFNRGSLLDLMRAQEDLYNAGRDLISSEVDRSLSRWQFLHLVAELEPQLAQAAPDSPSVPVQK